MKGEPTTQRMLEEGKPKQSDREEREDERRGELRGKNMQGKCLQPAGRPPADGHCAWGVPQMAQVRKDASRPMWR